MKRLNENNIDKLFNDGLSGRKEDVSFNEADWGAMENMLDKKSGKKPVLIRFMYYTSGIAALLLLAYALFWLPKKDSEDNRRPRVVKHFKKQSKDDGQFNQPEKLSAKELAVSKNNSRRVDHVPVAKGKSFFPLSVARNGSYVVMKEPRERHTDLLPPADTAQKIMASANVQSRIDSGVAVAQQIMADSNQILEKLQQLQPVIAPKVKTNNNFRPVLSLAVTGAPDVNGVSSLNGGKVGANLGVQFSVQLLPKLSITTGVAYAIKRYSATAGQYESNYKAYTPITYIDANCKVLDVPLNVNYQLYKKGNNALQLGTGLSSYWMLRENYEFEYANNVPSFYIKVANQNKHLLSILNLNATYQRRLGNGISAIVQPYYKIPLTGIGNGRVNLRSAGVAFGVGVNMNSLFRKPK